MLKSLHRECWLRLIIAALLNFALVVLALSLGVPGFGEWERPYHFHFITGLVAVVALVVVSPVLWRGTALEIILALWFAAGPIYRLFRVFEFWQETGGLCC